MLSVVQIVRRQTVSPLVNVNRCVKKAMYYLRVLHRHFRGETTAKESLSGHPVSGQNLNPKVFLNLSVTVAAALRSKVCENILTY